MGRKTSKVGGAGISAVVVRSALSVAVPLPCEVAVTVVTSLSPSAASAGTVTDTVNVVLDPAPRVTEASESVLVHTPVTLRSKVSVTFPELVTVTMYSTTVPGSADVA